MSADATWLARSKARVFLDMHLPRWPGKGIAERFDPPALAEAIADSGADSAVIYAKCQYGSFYTRLDGEELHPGLGGRDLLAETSAALRARGVRTLAYYSVSWDERVSDEHPEWLAQNAAGERGKGAWRWRTLCINGPYADVVEAHLRQIAAKPDIDGIWLDMTIIGDGNCYCPSCRAGFRAARGADPPTDAGSPLHAEFLGFRYGVVESFYERMREAIRGVSPELVFTNNYWGYPHSSAGMGSRAVGSTRQADFVTGEAYSDWSGIRSTTFLPVFLRGAAAGRPYEALVARAINTWDYTRKPPAYLAYEAFSLFAHGATVTVDDEPLPDGTVDAGFYRGDLRGIFSEIERCRQTVRGRPPRYAAVYHSQGTKDRRAPAEFVRDVSGAFRLLQDLHLPTEFVFDEGITAASLDGLSVLIVANPAVLAEGEWAALSAFMNAGGLLIVSGGLGEGPGARLAHDALGLLPQGISPYSLSYLRLPGIADHDLLVRGRGMRYAAASTDEGCVVDPICETGPREFFHNNLPGPHAPTTVPGLVLRRHGRGMCALFPQPLFRHYAKEPQRELRQVVHSVMSRFVAGPSVQLLIPMKMGYALYEDGDTLYVHLLNPNAEPSTCCGLMDTLDGGFERSYEYMEETVPVHDLGVRIAGRRCLSVEAVRERSACTVRQLPEGAEIRVARVELWEVLRIRLAAGGA